MDSIPKIIHYCWVGKKEKPQEVIETIADWTRKLEGYKIIEWNEDNFDTSIFITFFNQMTAI